MGVDIKFDFSEISDGIASIAKAIAEREDTIILKSAEAVRDKMKEKVRISKITDPEYTHIKDDIKISPLKNDKSGTKYREIYGGKKTGHKWKYLEYGTTKMDAIPFIQPSVEETAGERAQIARDELKKAVEK